MSDMLQLVVSGLPQAKAYRTARAARTKLPQIYRTIMTAFSRKSIVIVVEQEQII